MDYLHTDISDQSCPYCGENIRLIIETLDDTQSYIEDCEVCCRPIVVTVGPDGSVWLRAENEA